VGEPSAAASFLISAENLVRQHSRYDPGQCSVEDALVAQHSKIDARLGELECSNTMIDSRLHELAAAEDAFAAKAVAFYTALVHRRDLRRKAAIEAAIANADADDMGDGPVFEGDGPHPPPTRGPFDNGWDNRWNLNGEEHA
jgi:hypothetical protein